MKKLLFVLFLFALSCVEKEVSPEYISQVLDMTRLSPPDGWKPEDESARTQLVPCELDFKWWHQGSTTTLYTPAGGTFGNGNHFNVTISPQWSATGQTMYYFVTKDNVRFGLKMYNTGQSTFRYRFDGGSWVTLTAGQSGATVYYWSYSPTPVNCDQYSQQIGPVSYTVDIERTGCSGPPVNNMRAELRTVSVANGHNFGQPGFGVHANQLGWTHEVVNCNAP